MSILRLSPQSTDLCFKFPSEPFQKSYFNEMMDSNLFEDALSYFEQYFYSIEGNDFFYFFTVNSSEFIQVKRLQLRNYGIDNKTIKSLKMKVWDFCKTGRMFRLCFIADYYKIFKRDDQLFFNIAPIAGSITTASYNSFDEQSKNAVEMFWNHIKLVWSNNNENVFEYNKQWIINCVIGIKNKVAIVNYSLVEGVGKSIIPFILQQLVCGPVVLIDPRLDALKSNNSVLQGKCLLCLEEFQEFSNTVYKTKNQVLKELITSDVYTLKFNGGNPIPGAPNALSIMINTNERNAIPATNFSRRYMFNNCQYPEDWCKDKIKQYLENFFATCRYAPDFGHCFYAYCKENQDKDFKSANFPITNQTISVISDNIGPIEKFIKENFLYLKKALDVGIGDTFHNINATLSPNKQITFNYFYERICFYFQKFIQNGHITCPFSDLLSIFKQCNLISDAEIDCFINYKPHLTHNIKREDVGFVDVIVEKVEKTNNYDDIDVV